MQPANRDADEVITHPEQLTAHRLSAILRSTGGIRPDDGVQHIRVSDDYVRSHRIVHLIAQTDAGREVRLVLKCCVPSQTMHAREVEFYQTIAPLTPQRLLPTCYDVAYCSRTRQFHLLLEDLTGRYEPIHCPAAEPPPATAREGMARALGLFHGHWLDSTELPKGPIDAQGIVAQAESRDTKLSERLRFHWREFTTHELSAYSRALGIVKGLYAERICQSRGVTIIHGDAHCGNFLFPVAEDQSRATPVPKIIDWPNWIAGLPTDDIAYMMSGWVRPDIISVVPELARLHFSQLASISVAAGATYDWDQYRSDFMLSTARACAHAFWDLAQDDPPDWAWKVLESSLLLFVSHLDIIADS